VPSGQDCSTLQEFQSPLSSSSSEELSGAKKKKCLRGKKKLGGEQRERNRVRVKREGGGCVLYDDPRQKAEETGIRNHVVVYLPS
jgi:hypothetical protein